MTKDYARARRLNMKDTANRQSSSSQTWSSKIAMDQFPTWAWMLAGLMLGILITSTIFLTIYAKEQRQQSVSFTNKEEQHQPTNLVKEESPATENTLPATKQPRFDFYTLLPNMAVEVPDVAAPEQVKSSVSNKPVTATQSSTKKNLAFIIQAGSFRQKNQAESLKASLALTGFEASIQTVRINEDDLWYRVYIGPYGNKDDAVNIQKQLEQTQPLNSLVLKIRA